MYTQYFLEYFEKFDYSAFGDKKTAPWIPDVRLDTIEMSSSWNFPARASPGYEGSEPILGTSIFELKPSKKILKH